MTVRTRFAPSPTGPLHMGGVRTALYAYLFARQHQGTFILRIEDTDQHRFVPGAEDYISEALAWCGIITDESPAQGGKHAPYRQSERKELGYYQQYAQQLIESGHAYYAFDTSEELETARKTAEASGDQGWQYSSVTRMQFRNSLTCSEQETNDHLRSGKPYVIRLKAEPGQTIMIDDMVRGEVHFDSTLVDDKVLIKADGMPTYHLAHIVDDIMMEITHAIRGEEWLPSAPAHVLIYEYLGMKEKMPRYAHLPLLLKPEGNGKLSKRDGDRLGFPVFPLKWTDPVSGEVSSGYREQGYYPHAFVNMLALLGWNPGTEKEIFSMEELISSFTFERVHKSGARFDPEKTKWFNEQYLRMETDEALGERLYVAVRSRLKPASQESRFTPEFCKAAIPLLKERVQFEEQLYDEGISLFERPEVYDEKVIGKRWNTATAQFMEQFAGALDGAKYSHAGELKLFFEEQATGAGFKPGDVLQLFRVLLSGKASGIDLFGMAYLLGKAEVKERLKIALEKLKEHAA